MLKIKKFPKLWQGAAHDPQFRALQDKVQYEEYFLPAIELAQRWGITTQIGMLIFCDTNIQHGMESDGPKSPGLASMAGQAQPSGKNFVEKEYLTSFLKIRRKVLMNNGSDWADSLGRVDCLLDLLNASMELKTPFKINPWGDDQPFLITGV